MTRLSGAWASQHILRHKTRKEPFRSRLGTVILAHLTALTGKVWWRLRG